MNVDDAMEAAAEFRAAIEAHCAWPLFSETVAITLAKEVERLRAELDQYKKSLPVCEKHKPDSGCRSGCMICGLEKQSSALSRIDYACGEQNEMQMSLYGWDYDEERVVQAVQRLNAELTAAKAEVERLTREIERAYERAEVEQQLLQLGPPQAGRKWLRAKVDQLQAELAAAGDGDTWREACGRVEAELAKVRSQLADAKAASVVPVNFESYPNYALNQVIVNLDDEGDVAEFGKWLDERLKERGEGDGSSTSNRHR